MYIHPAAFEDKAFATGFWACISGPKEADPNAPKFAIHDRTPATISRNDEHRHFNFFFSRVDDWEAKSWNKVIVEWVSGMACMICEIERVVAAYMLSSWRIWITIPASTIIPKQSRIPMLCGYWMVWRPGAVNGTIIVRIAAHQLDLTARASMRRMYSEIMTQDSHVVRLVRFLVVVTRH